MIKEKTRLEIISELNDQYGDLSFRNYAFVRYIAEQIRDGFNLYLGCSDEKPVVFLVPPQGSFYAVNARSAAFSNFGKEYLTMDPISFGLAVQLQNMKDIIRLVITVIKSGPSVDLKIKGAKNFDLNIEDSDDKKIQINQEELQNFFFHLFNHLKSIFEDQIEQFNDGEYGLSEIGFDISRITEEDN